MYSLSSLLESLYGPSRSVYIKRFFVWSVPNSGKHSSYLDIHKVWSLYPSGINQVSSIEFLAYNIVNKDYTYSKTKKQQLTFTKKLISTMLTGIDNELYKMRLVVSLRRLLGSKFTKKTCHSSFYSEYSGDLLSSLIKLCLALCSHCDEKHSV